MPRPSSLFSDVPRLGRSPRVPGFRSSATDARPGLAREVGFDEMVADRVTGPAGKRVAMAAPAEEPGAVVVGVGPELQLGLLDNPQPVFGRDSVVPAIAIATVDLGVEASARPSVTKTSPSLKPLTAHRVAEGMVKFVRERLSQLAIGEAGGEVGIIRIERDRHEPAAVAGARQPKLRIVSPGRRSTMTSTGAALSAAETRPPTRSAVTCTSARICSRHCARSSIGFEEVNAQVQHSAHLRSSSSFDGGI